MTVIGLIRHGITDWNIAKRAQGHTDIPLNATGKEQAQAVAKRLQNEPWDIVVASDLSRARETAETIGRALGISVTVDTRLRETGCGKIEGTTEEERIATWGENWRTLDLGIEDKQSVIARCSAVLEELCRDYPDGRILVVSHGALMGNTLRSLIPDLEMAEHLQNTSVTIIRYEHDHWTCALYNCITHLDALDAVAERNDKDKPVNNADVTASDHAVSNASGTSR